MHSAVKSALGRDYGNTTELYILVLKKKNSNQKPKTNKKIAKKKKKKPQTKLCSITYVVFFLRPNKHLHDVIQFCEVHFERLIWSYGLSAVGSEGFEELVRRDGSHF